MPSGTDAAHPALAPEIATVFIPAAPTVRHISSTLVRQIAQLGGDVAALTPAAVAETLAGLQSP